MVAQTERAIAEADRLIVLVDGRAGLTPQDQFAAQLARRSGKPVVLAVNKTEGFDRDIAVADFHQLGLGEPLAIAAAHDQGVTASRGGARGPRRRTRRRPETGGIQVAVIGRPNVGKSTLDQPAARRRTAWSLSTSRAPPATPSWCPSSATASATR